MTRLVDAPFSRIVPMTEVKTAIETAPVRAGWSDWAALVKPRLSLMVLFTVAIGFLLASVGTPHWLSLIHVLIGTGLLAAGASALNQVWERHTDALMKRTRNRPLPTGRIGVAEALCFGFAASAVGLVNLTLLVNPLTAALGLLTLASYVLAYTPLKKWTALNTLIGAVPGALPPIMGWTAAGGELNLQALSLFGILFLWQFPHFWSIAWIYRRDYAAAGMRMIPVLDRENGRMTGRMMVHHCLLLCLAGFGPYFVGLAGIAYVWGAAALGLMFLGFGFLFLIRPSDARARWTLWASLVYLPLMLTLLFIDRV